MPLSSLLATVVDNHHVKIYLKTYYTTDEWPTND